MPLFTEVGRIYINLSQNVISLVFQYLYFTFSKLNWILFKRFILDSVLILKVWAIDRCVCVFKSVLLSLQFYDRKPFCRYIKCITTVLLLFLKRNEVTYFPCNPLAHCNPNVMKGKCRGYNSVVKWSVWHTVLCLTALRYNPQNWYDIRQKWAQFLTEFSMLVSIK